MVTAESQLVLVAVTVAVVFAAAKSAAVEYSRQTAAEAAPSPKPATRGVAATLVRVVSPSLMAM